jgi:hypothetical protein
MDRFVRLRAFKHKRSERHAGDRAEELRGAVDRSPTWTR